MAEAKIIKDNNPNNAWGKHVIEVVLKQWQYERSFVTRIGGNCHGFTLFETAVGNVYDSLIDTGEFIMTAANGDTLSCSDDDSREEEWIKKMVVSCRIIDFEPPTLNEIRARNGAAPVPHGDKPYIAGGSSQSDHHQ